MITEEIMVMLNFIHPFNIIILIKTLMKGNIGRSEQTDDQSQQAMRKVVKRAEYLQNMQQFVQNQNKFIFPLKQRKYSLKSFCKIITQATYLLFACFSLRIKIYISKYLYSLKFGQNPEEELLKDYLFAPQFQKSQVLKRKYIQNNFMCLDSNVGNQQFITFCFALIDLLLMQAKECVEKGLFFYNIISDITYKVELMEFNQIFHKIIKPHRQSIKHPLILMKIFEQTKLFQQNSLLLKYSKRALFFQIKSNTITSSALQSYKREIAMLKLQKASKNGSDTQTFIQKWLQKFFSALVHEKILVGTKSISKQDQNGEMESQNFNILTFERKNNMKLMTANFERRQQKYYPLTLQTLGKLIGDSKVEIAQEESFQEDFKISFEYSYADNELIVKLLTSLEVTPEQNDFFSITCNNLSCQFGKIDVFLQNCKSANLRKEKYVAYKISCLLSIKEEPLCQILYLMDYLILCHVIISPQLYKNVPLNSKSIEDLRKKFDHMNSVILKNVRNHYLCT